MNRLLDTDIIIHFLRGHERVVHRMATLPHSSLAVPAIAVAELYFGAFNSIDPARNCAVVDTLRRQVQIIPFDDEAAVLFGRLKARLRDEGALIPDSALFIAATALVTGSVLVTANTTHFERIEELRLEDWTR